MMPENIARLVKENADADLSTPGPDFRESHAWSYGYDDGSQGNRNAAKHWDATSDLVAAYERGHAFGSAIRENLLAMRTALSA